MTTPGAVPDPRVAGTVDLHLHTTASDGTWSPGELVAEAQRLGLHAIALTDHDSVGGVETAIDAARGTPLEIIAGVELSCYQGNDETHLLGLHLKNLVTVDAALQRFRDARRERAAEMVSRLNGIGVRITFDDVLEVARESAIGRPHVAKALVEHGWARDFRDAFDRYLGFGRPAFLEKLRLSMRDAIALVHDAGGLAILAHPGPHAGPVRLAALQQQGLDGVEVLHPGHTMDDRQRILEAAASLALVPSGGSDSHGPTTGPRQLGALAVPREWLDQQLRQVERVRRRGVTAA